MILKKKNIWAKIFSSELKNTIKKKTKKKNKKKVH